MEKRKEERIGKQRGFFVIASPINIGEGVRSRWLIRL